MIKIIRSFTIVELLVVMAVIGVLLSLSVFGIQALQKSQRETMRLTDLNNLHQQLESFYNQNNRYPGGLSSDNSQEIQISNDQDSISIYNFSSGNQFGSSIPLQAAGLKVGEGSNYTTDSCPETDMSADIWYIVFFSSKVGQQFGLWGCTENGPTTNFGILQSIPGPA